MKRRMFEPTTHVPALSTADFTFLRKHDYLLDLIERVKKTKKGDRVLVVTHDFHPTEPLIATLMETLTTAAKRGVTTQFAVDERTFPVMQKVPLTKAAHTLIQATHETLATLKTAGAAYAITNKTYHRVINRFSGRAHIKVAIVNDTVYVGGCNLTDTKQIDLMVRWHDPKAAAWLYSTMSDMIRTKSSQAAFTHIDQSFALDKDTTLLLDSGKPRQSIIFDNALRLIDEAKEWIVLTCQYFPSSVTAHHLAKAHKRGVKVSLYYNHPSIHKPGFNALMHTVVIREKTRQPAALFAQQLGKHIPYVHAKILATEQAAMVGSHNYVITGVTLGTAELTLLRNDPVFSTNVAQYFKNLVQEYN